MRRALAVNLGLWLLATTVLLLTTSVSVLAIPAIERVPHPDTGRLVDVVAEQLLVVWSPSISAAAMEQANQAFGAQVMRRLPITGAQQLRLPSGTSVVDAMKHYRRLSGALSVRPNYLWRITRTPNDPLFPSQTYMVTINAPTGWDISVGSPSVVVAVLDSGIQASHPEFQGKLWVNTGETPGNGVDDDGNGYVDDYAGWDFVHNNNNPSPNPNGIDDDGMFGPDTGVPHGTGVGGLIGALTDNNVGIASVGWDTKLMNLQAGDDEGGLAIADIEEGFYYAVNMGAHIINCSFGGSYDAGFQPVVDYAYNHNVLVVAAAGNDGVNLNAIPMSPVCNDGPDNRVVGAAATSVADIVPDWSNYGSQYTDVCAPGVSVLTTTYYDPVYNFNDRYETMSGTSFSSPITAGLAALLKAASPSATPAELRDLLKAGAVNIDALNPGLAGQLGAGRIDCFASLAGTTRFPVPAGLSLLSFGTNLGEQTDTPEEIFGTSDVTVHAWVPTLPTPDYVAYPDPAHRWFQPTAGYWVRLSEPVVAQVQGGGLPQDQSAEITLDQGWNLFGCPFTQALPWDTLTITVRVGSLTKTLAEAAQAGEVYAYLWAYDQEQGYVPIVYFTYGGAVEFLHFRQGYWIYAATDATLILPPPASSTTAVRRQAAPPAAWSLPLLASTRAGRFTASVGAMPQGSQEVSLLAPPALTGQPAIHLLAFDTPGIQRKLAPSAFYMPALGALSQPARWEFEVLAAPRDEVRLSWPNLNALPRSFNLTLQDLDTGSVLSLRTSAFYSFVASENPRRFRLTVSPSAAGALVLQMPPPQQSRSGAYEFSLLASTACYVTLEVYTLSGEPIATVKDNAPAVAGLNKWLWMPQTRSGAPMAPGSYLLRARAADASGQAANAVRVFQLR